MIRGRSRRRRGERRGQDLILTPGVYHLHQTIEITRPDTVVLGLGFPTMVPANGIVSMRFDSSEVGQSLTEIVAYGTAVIIGAG